MADLSQYGDDELEEALRRKRQSSLADVPDDVLEQRLAELRKPEPSMLQRAGQLFTGNAAEEAPALLGLQPRSADVAGRRMQVPVALGGTTFGQGDGVDSAAVFGGDNDVLNAYLRANPNAKATQDANGNAMVEVDGRRMYVNQPGLDTTDVTRFAGKALSFLPAGKLAGGLSTLAGRVGVGALGAGATDVGMQVASGRSASDFDPVQTGIAAASGGIAETIMPIWNAGKRVVQSYRSPQVQISAGRTIAQRAGLQDVSDDAAKALARRSDEIAAGADPRAILAEQEFGYRLTRGQMTGDEAVLRKEELLRAQNPNGPLGRLEKHNIAATQANVERFREQAARGGTPEAFEQDAAQRLRDGLSRAKDSAQQQVRGAYSEVPSKSAFASPEDVGALASRLDEVFINSDTILGDLTPATMTARRVINQAAEQSGGMPIRMDRLIDLRKSLSRLRGSAEKEDARAYSIMMKEFDGWFDESLTRNLMAGAPDAVAPFREANQIASRYFSLFEDRKSEPGKAIMRMLTEDATPEQVANVLLNANGINKPGAAAIAKRYIETVGRDTDGVTAMREIIVRRLFEKSGDPKGHQALVSSLKDALNGRGRSLMSTVFNKTELAMMDKFARTVDQYFVPKGMLGRSSGTAERLAAFLAPFGSLPMAGTLRKVNDTLAAQAATRPLLTARPAGLPAAVAAGATGSQEDRRRRQSSGGQRP